MLNTSDIIHEAEQRIGISDSDVTLRPNLEKLVSSIISDAQLPAWGEESIRKSLVDRTADRLEGLRWLREYPEIIDEKIVAPIFLTGLPRSGTTYFQYLFDRDPRFRLIRTWEAITPLPPPGFDPASVVRRKAEEGERRRQVRPQVEGFESLHLVDPDGPEECHAFLEQSYAAAGLQNILNVPSYFEYLTTTLNFTAVYQCHKRQLQLLQWRMPQRRWALKYPNHLLAMDAIFAVYPDAHFIMTHRDPVQTLASIAKLTCALRGTRYDKPVDPHAVGRQMLHFVRRHIDRIMSFSEREGAERVIHVDYYRLLDNPAAVMAEVHQGLGIGSPEEVHRAVAEWHRKNPKNARGANLYTLEQFGLNEDEVAERFSHYMRRFAIPRERIGLARNGR